MQSRVPSNPSTPDNDPVRIWHTKKYMVPAEMESWLRRRNDVVFTRRGWSDAVRARGLFVDLSRIQWVELSAVLRTALLIERARQDGIAVAVAMPLGRPRATEEFFSRPEHTSDARHRRVLQKRPARRRAARTFLERLRFLEAIRAPHLEASTAGSLSLVSDYDSSTDRAFVSRGIDIDADEEMLPPLAEREPYVVPLMWVSADPAAKNTKAVAERLVEVLGNQPRGIGSRFDAAALSQVILGELVANAIEYSGARRALVAAFAHPASLSLRANDYTPSEHAFAGWMSQAARPGVEVVVGDSGRGIPNVLGDAYDIATNLPRLPEGRAASVIAWAFDRRSTSVAAERRGTRGLYRVDRVVKRHAGMITIRSENQLIGWDHGGLAHDVQLVEREARLGFVPGTVLRAHLGALPDALAERHGGEPPGDLTFTFHSVALSYGQVLVDDRPLAALPAGTSDDCRVLLPTPDLTVHDLPALITELARARDPETTVLVGVADFGVAAEACNAINQDVGDRREHLEETEGRAYEVSDPVLVVGHGVDDVVWAGTTPAAAAVLSALLAAPGARITHDELMQICPDAATRSEVRMALRRDSGLARFDEDGIQLRLHLRALVDGFAARMAARVEKQLAGSESKPLRITPSLAQVRAWVSVDRLLALPVDLSLATFALAHRVHLGAGLVKPPTLVLADASVDRDRLRRVQTALRAARHETVPIEVGADGSEGGGIAEDVDRVVVYADLVASGESVRRCLLQLLRDGATPLAVACLVDTRVAPHEPVNVWGIQIPVISLVAAPTAAGLRDNEDPIFVDALNNEEKWGPGPAPYPLPPAELLEIAATQKAIHFGHIGGNAGRHFTLYVNAKKLLDAPQLSDKFEETVLAWVDENASRRPGSVEVWYPTPEPKVPRPAEALARRLEIARPELRLRGIARQPIWGGWKFPVALPDLPVGTEIVIVDWGALEGTTIMELVRLASEAGATRVMACVALSQLAPEPEWQLRAVRKVEVRRPQVAPDLFAVEQATLRQTPVRVEFISALPVRAFGASDCPMCAQRHHLAKHKMPTGGLRQFAKRQREERLQLTTREDIVTQRLQDLDRIELDGEQTVRMLRIRDRLERSLQSTRARYELFSWLQEVPPAGDDARDLVRFLAAETQWLRRPPLVFDDVRAVIASLAARMSCDETTAANDLVNAISVLRTSSKSEFAKQAPEIFLRCVDDAAAMQQLFHGFLTYSERPYLQAEGAWEPLVNALSAMRDRISDGEVPSSEGGQEIRVLLDRAKTRLGVARLAEQPLPSTWAHLSRLFGAEYDRHGIGASIRRLEQDVQIRDALRGVDDAAVNEWTDSVLQDWDKVARFLRDEIVPPLRHLRQTLDSDVARETFGPEWTLLVGYLDQAAGVAEWPIEQVVRRVRDEHEKLSEDRNWAWFRHEVQWLSDVLLRPGVDDAEFNVWPSRLTQLLRSVPADLGEAIRHVKRQSWGPKIDAINLVGVSDESIPVFFPGSELRELVTELVRNVEEHHDAHLGASDAQHFGSRVEFSVDVGEDVVLRVVNTASKISENPGLLLKRFTEEVAAFDGLLDHRAVGGDPTGITYQVTLMLRRAV